jgi:hypothetical protein
MCGAVNRTLNWYAKETEVKCYKVVTVLILCLEVKLGLRRTGLFVEFMQQKFILSRDLPYAKLKVKILESK